MKLNLDAVLFMPDRKTAMTYANSTDILTMGMLLSEAAIGMYPTETIDGDEKSLRFRLSVRTAMGGEQNFSKNEIDCLMRVANLKCGTWLYGQVEAWTKGAEPFRETVNAGEPEEIPQEQAA